MAKQLNASATALGWSKTPKNANVLVVGAGGIGCELLKNLVMTGFQKIQVIDLDTIDVSNLNRQFLFHREHVGKSKAVVAVEKMHDLMKRTGRGDCVDQIKAFHGSIFDPQFDVAYFGQYDIVLSALDNKAARSHVNRLCIAAEVTLVESGTAGYLGQVTVIAKGVSECYDCLPKPVQRTYPGCTIRNTPSEPIHCIVWAKHLFNQLFGEPDIDEDVAPDMHDPEMDMENGANGDANGTAENGDGGEKARQGVRAWAESIDYEADRVFDKLFSSDVEALLKMDTLWKKRQPPKAVTYDQVIKSEEHDKGGSTSTSLADQSVWSLKECADTFAFCLMTLKRRLHTDPAADSGKATSLCWDKDDDDAMNFVVAVANIRAHVFRITMKSRFDIKSMAGNIIPAIATTNAVIAGCIVVEALKVMRTGNTSECRAVFFAKQPNPRGQTLVNQELPPQNTKCMVCAKARIYVKLNTKAFTVRQLRDLALKKQLAMAAPDVVVLQTHSIVISSDETECQGLLDKTLADVGIVAFSELAADDYVQSLDFVIVVIHDDTIGKDRADTDLFTVMDTAPPLPTKEASSRKRTLDHGDEGPSDDDYDLMKKPRVVDGEIIAEVK